MQGVSCNACKCMHYKTPLACSSNNLCIMKYLLHALVHIGTNACKRYVIMPSIFANGLLFNLVCIVHIGTNERRTARLTDVQSSLQAT